ncbi:MAG: site-specific integrase [Leptospiraceae bacterium]|nr:site-specific integrase [Leptospiraceae bacterium]
MAQPAKVIQLNSVREQKKARKKSGDSGGPRKPRSARAKAPELQAILDLKERLELAIDEVQLRDRCILHLLTATGMRASELCELKLSNFEKDIDGSPAVTFYRKKRKDWHTVKLGKAHFRKLMAVIRDYHRAAGVEDDHILWSRPNVITGERTHLVTRSLQRVVNSWGIKDGRGKTLAPHSLRHLVGILATRTRDHIFAQKLLGHSDPKTTSAFYTDQYVQGIEI